MQAGHNSQVYSLGASIVTIYAGNTVISLISRGEVASRCLLKLENYWPTASNSTQSPCQNMPIILVVGVAEASPPGTWCGEVAMTMTLRIVGFCVLSSLMLAGEQAHGQLPQLGAADQARTRLASPAMQYFGRNIRKPVARPQARHQAPPTQRFQLAGGKPFQNVSRGPAVSPYLGLDTLQSSVSLPNYYSRVLPQIRQQEANQSQAVELRRLQQQVRTARAPGAISNNRNGGVPTTGHSSQFLNNGGYFPSISR